MLDRNLQEVFGEGDNDSRRAAIGELWAEDGVLYVPPGAIIGHDAIDKFAGDLREDEMPHFIFGSLRIITRKSPHGRAGCYLCSRLLVR